MTRQRKRGTQLAQLGRLHQGPLPSRLRGRQWPTAWPTAGDIEARIAERVVERTCCRTRRSWRESKA